MSRLRPGTLAGIFGMALVVALYIAHALLIKGGGSGLSVWWLSLLVLPGVLAAYLSRRTGSTFSAEREGVFAGILTAHFASLLQVVVLIIAVLNIDWSAYALMVGPEISSGVRAMSVPATAVASIALIAVTYTGCIFASWIGALVHGRIFSS